MNISPFNRIASRYNQAAALYEEISARLIDYLDPLPIQTQNTLDLGAGTGLLTQKLQKRFPEAHIIALDNARCMLDEAKKSLPSHFVCADSKQVPLADSSIDLIASNLMLPWCPDLKATFKEIKRLLRPHGLLLFSTFGPDTLQELRQAWAQVDNTSHIHTFTDMHDIGDMLLQCQLDDPVMATETLTITYPDVYTLLRELKNTGSNNQTNQRRTTLTGKNRLQKLIAAYNNQHNANNALPASFEIIYGVAWNQSPHKPPKTDVPTEFYIPIERISRAKN